MAIDAKLSSNVRAALLGAGAIREVKMFGGLGFMLNGNMVTVASSRGLLLRVGRAARAKALTRRGARPMVMKNRRMDDYIYVDPEVLDGRTTKSWVKTAVEVVETLPPHSAGGKGAKTKRRINKRGQRSKE
jgi:TfoX/Sxy family transcriptional regulator of competence genes